MSDPITQDQADILDHTSRNGRFVTSDPKVMAMATDGLLFDYGAQELAAGDHFFTLTAKGRQSLSDWRDAQPKPVKSKRKKTQIFADWQNYCEAFNRMPFSEFWKQRHEYARWRSAL